MQHARGRGQTEAQRHRLLMDTIGRHTFEARQIERRLRRGPVEHGVGRANLPVERVEPRTFADGGGRTAG
jgi:hypothetical protein